MQQPQDGEIKDQFRKYGDTFFLVSLSGDYRIYRRESRNDGFLRVQYEIVKPVMMGGVLRYPPSSMWGIYGWTCNTEKHVINKINELMERDKQNEQKK